MCIRDRARAWRPQWSSPTPSWRSTLGPTRGASCAMTVRSDCAAACGRRSTRRAAPLRSRSALRAYVLFAAPGGRAARRPRGQAGRSGRGSGSRSQPSG
eukprot:1877437-Alexandrium_andersonii.AAC.1